MKSRARERKALLAATLASLWLAAFVPLTSQEAYYWLYAQHPALSYFDHPPMDAWWIWIGTHVLGDGALAVRLGTVLAGLGTTLIGLALLRDFGLGARGRLAWIFATSTVPALLVSRFLANPDPPLVLFWTATMLCLWRARDGRLRWWILAGCAAGAAALSKYSAAFLLPSGMAVLVLDRKMRTQLRSYKPYLAVVLAMAVFWPVIAWNLSHDFASFRFQTANRYENASFNPGRALSFMGTQALMTNPFFLPILFSTAAWLWRRSWRATIGVDRGADRARDMRARWLLIFALPLPLYMLANSPFMRIKANWLTPAYIPLALAAACWLDTRRWKSLPRPMRHMSLIGSAVLALAITLSPLARLLPASRGTTLNGWHELALSAQRWAQTYANKTGQQPFYFAADYKDAAQLSHALADIENTATPVLAQNVIGQPALQFNYWQKPEDYLGRTAIFVLARAKRRAAEVEKLRSHFRHLKKLENSQSKSMGITLMDAAIYACSDYLGPQPQH